TCAHPAIEAPIRAPLMLQVVLGLDAAMIASAFLMAPATMGQRLVRAKTKIRQAGIPRKLDGWRAARSLGGSGVSRTPRGPVAARPARSPRLARADVARRRATRGETLIDRRIRAARGTGCHPLECARDR